MNENFEAFDINLDNLIKETASYNFIYLTNK